jgi:hypothetical protein
LRIGGHQLVLSAWWRGTPRGDPTIRVVVIVEVANRPFVAHEETRFVRRG